MVRCTLAPSPQSCQCTHPPTTALVVAATDEPEANNTIKMEVGIEDCLHIEFEYNKSKFHLQDAVLGKIFFLLVRGVAPVPDLAMHGSMRARRRAPARCPIAQDGLCSRAGHPFIRR